MKQKSKIKINYNVAEYILYSSIQLSLMKRLLCYWKLDYFLSTQTVNFRLIVHQRHYDLPLTQTLF